MRRGIILGLAAALLGGLVYGGVVYYRSTHFLLTASTPRSNASSLTPVALTFNRTLASNAAQTFKITPYVAGKINMSGQTINFEPTIAYNLNVTYTVTLSDVHAADGSVVGKVKFSFKPTYIRFDKLPASEQQAQINQTDALTASNPLLAVLPANTLHYQISYTLNDKQQPVYQISLNAIQLSDSEHDQYIANLKQFKQEALDFIRQNGGDPATMSITYDPSEAASL